jgi:hypothetical protein
MNRAATEHPLENGKRDESRKTHYTLPIALLLYLGRRDESRRYRTFVGKWQAR